MKSVIVIGAGISGLCTAALLAKDGIKVQVYEKSRRLGGRTASMQFKGHTLDNGFHIMPFYKTSAVYKVLQSLRLVSSLDLVKVDKISFYRDGFYMYPRGILDILCMSLVPFQSRIKLLGILAPMAFSSMQRTERADSVPLSHIVHSLDTQTRSFFDAVCMLAFADVPERVSLGEFMRTIIRANPFRGGTSEFAYPASGGYDKIAYILASYIKRHYITNSDGSDNHNNNNNNNKNIHTSTAVSKIIVEDGRACGVILEDGSRVIGNSVVISCPAYDAIDRFFETGTFSETFEAHVKRLNKTTSVVETHYCLSNPVDTRRQIVFPVGDNTTAKGVFFISNITPAVSPKGEHLMMAGTPIRPQDADDASMVKNTADAMKSDISQMYPDFEDSLLWERPMVWRLVESVAKEPGIVWKDKMPHEVEQVKGLYFVGDSTVSYGIGTDSAAHSSILCHPKIVRYLRS